MVLYAETIYQMHEITILLTIGIFDGLWKLDSQRYIIVFAILDGESTDRIDSDTIIDEIFI